MNSLLNILAAALVIAALTGMLELATRRSETGRVIYQAFLCVLLLLAFLALCMAAASAYGCEMPPYIYSRIEIAGGLR